MLKIPAITPEPEQPVERLAVSVKEAAAMLSVSERTIHNLAARGQLKPIRAGWRKLYPVEQLRRFVNGEPIDAT